MGRFGFVLLLAALAFEHALPGQAQSAVELAKRVDDHYNHLQSLKTSFTEQYDGMGMHRSELGTMLLRKPGRMRWDYTSTAGKVFILDGKYGWFYAPGASQVQRIPASQLDDLRSPLRFLLGHTKIESELEGLMLAPAAQGSFRLTGVPKGLQNRVARLSLTIKQDGAIQHIEIEEKDGALTAFDFSNEQANPVIPESAFHFTPPAGIPAVDAPPPV